MANIFCVSAGQLESKKKNSLFSQKHRYLNYGLLKIASTLGKYDYRPIVVHGLFDPPSYTLEVCNQLGINENKNPVLLSIPSFFALEWARVFSNCIKSSNQEKQIIVGGRWVVGENKEWLMQYLDVDAVIPGLVSDEVVDIVGSFNNSKSSYMNHGSMGIETRINYDYLHERHLFQPSIEVSNGCGMGCSFCEEKSIPLSKLKSASLIAEEMKSLVRNDGLSEITPYLESSMFVAKKEWANALISKRAEIGVTSKWRVESRVDKLKANNIPALAKAGLKVIDLGLESASHIQLERMNKTSDSKSYLESASKLIKIAHDHGIWV